MTVEEVGLFLDTYTERYIHTKGVEKTARKMAEFFHEDVKKAGLAGLLHDCAKCLSLDKMNKAVKGSSKIESMVTGVEKGQRSFKVSVNPPQGLSYAKDIAQQYGVTFEKIKSTIDGRNI